ncbi:MAG: VWA domain-containing protein [Oscillospiraceae bacterium]|nr:VWA domain-containing protein [Oscillospiraceae bacterium]
MRSSKYKKQKRAAVFTALLMLFWAVLTAYPVFADAEGSGTKQGYTPMHMAIILDSSNSVGNSKETLLNSRSGAACLASSVPLKDNKIAVFSYSDRRTDQANGLIKGDRLQPVTGLTGLDNYQKRSTVISQLNDMRKCAGGTAMVYAIRDAAAYLKQNKDPNAKDVIVVFTDGEETEALNEQKVAADPNLIDNTVRQALEGSDAKVYSIAYDHNGSITGANGGSGYGYKLLKRFEELSGGRVYDTGQISDLPKCFDEIIGEVCCLPFDENNRLSVKGDGGMHEKIIHVPPCVAEATIRISCGQLNVIRDGKLQLLNEHGEDVALAAGSDTAVPAQNVWYTVDDLGATIKLREPNKGDWTVRVSNMISEQDIRETWIMQYNMSVEFAADTSVSYNTGTTVPVRVILRSDGKEVTDPEIYRTETDANGLSLHADLICSDGTALPADFGNPRAEEVMGKLMKLPNARAVPLKQLNPDDPYFTAEIPLESAGSKLLSVWIDSAYFYCYADKSVTVGESIPDAVKVPAITVENGKTVETILLSEGERDGYTGWEIRSEANSLIDTAEEGFTLKVTGKQVGKCELWLHFNKKDSPAPPDTVVPVTVINSKPTLKAGAIQSEISLEKGESETLSGLSKCAEDFENDPLTVTLGSAGDAKIASAVLNGDSLLITGVNAGNTAVTLNISDGTDTVSHTVRITVTLSAKDAMLKWLPWIIGALLLLIVIIVLMAIAAKKKRRLFITLKKAVYVECGADGIRQKDMTLAADVKLNAKFECGEIKLGMLLNKLAGLSMDPAVQQLAMPGASHRFEETCGIADAISCIGGKNEADGVRFTGKHGSLMADGQMIGEKIEMYLRTEPGGTIGLICRLASGEFTQIWLCTKESTIDYSQKGEAAVKAWEKLLAQAQPAEAETSAEEPAPAPSSGGWQSGETKPETAPEQPSGGSEQSAGGSSGSGWSSGSSGSGWGSSSNGSSGSGWGGSSGSGSSGSGWGGSSSSGSSGSGWGSGSSGGSSGSGWGSGNSGKKW